MMLSTLAGSFFILTGLLPAANPERLRKRIRSKGIRSIKRILLAAGLSAGALLVSIGWQYPGVIPKFIAGAGVILILRMIYLAKAKSADLISERLMTLPAFYIRFFALGQIAVGAFLVFGLKG